MGELVHRTSKKGKRYATFFVEDFTGRLKAFLFPSAYVENWAKLENDKPIMLEGFYDVKDDEPKLVVHKVSDISNEVRSLHIRIPYDSSKEVSKTELVKVLSNYKGNVEVLLFLPNRKILVLDERYNVKPSMELKMELEDLCGKGQISFA